RSLLRPRRAPSVGECPSSGTAACQSPPRTNRRRPSLIRSLLRPARAPSVRECPPPRAAARPPPPRTNRRQTCPPPTILTSGRAPSVGECPSSGTATPAWRRTEDSAQALSYLVIGPSARQAQPLILVPEPGAVPRPIPRQRNQPCRYWVILNVTPALFFVLTI